MSSTARPLEELVAAFRAGTLKLPALFTALDERGAVTAAQHARETAWLEHLRDEEGFDSQVVRALLGKLADMQPQTADSAGAAGPTGAQDATQVAPVAAGSAADAATVVNPAAHAGTTTSHTQGGTGTSSSLDTSTWQRVADEAAGEQATVGMRLKGRFLLEREIGRGGMGVVYLARDERKVEARDRDPYVAVKVLNDEFRRHPDSLIALQRESRRSQQLAHDNIVRVYDFDKDGTIVFMTMEYIDGTNLKTLIREEAFNGMPLAKARPLIEGMAWALKRAHTAGVVHSDFKPGNVMVTKDGVPKVFDFGIARAGKRAGANPEEQTVFDAGTLGALTPAYASLEMLRGADPTPADDIYALGCVAYELLTGKHPFDRVSAEVALREGRKPPHVHGLTRRQNQTLQKAVALQSRQRLQKVEQVVTGLRVVGLRERWGRPLLYAALVILILLGIGWGVLARRQQQQMAQVVAGFQPHDAQRYANASQAVAALAGLSENERKQLLVEHGDLVQKFLVGRVDAYWDPGKGRHDYAAAERVFAEVDTLHLFLPQLDLKRAAMEKQKQALERPQPSKPAAAQPEVAAHQVPAADRSVVAPPATEVAHTSSTAQPPLVVQTPAASKAAQAGDAQQAAAAAKAHMREVAAGLLRIGERNYAQQKYSAAIANAKAALQINPGDPGARRLLQRAKAAQQRAMSDITIH